MDDVLRPVLNSNSISKIHQSQDERFLYSISSALYSNRIESKQFHQAHAYTKYKKLLNIGSMPFPLRKGAAWVFEK